MINKFTILSGRKNEIEKEDKDYHFDPKQLQELVTKRKSFQDFKFSLRFMNKSYNIVKNLEKKKNVKLGESDLKLKIPIGKVIADKKKVKLLDNREKGALKNVGKRLIEKGNKRKEGKSVNKRIKSKSQGKGEKKRGKSKNKKKSSASSKRNSITSNKLGNVLNELEKIKKIEKLELELDLNSIKDFTSRKLYPITISRKKLCYFKTKKEKASPKNKHEINNKRCI